MAHTTRTQIIPTHRVSAETHATSVEVKGLEMAEKALSILQANMPNHDWKLTEI